MSGGFFGYREKHRYGGFFGCGGYGGCGGYDGGCGRRHYGGFREHFNRFKSRCGCGHCD